MKTITTIIFDLSEVLITGLHGTHTLIGQKLGESVEMEHLLPLREQALYRGEITERAYWEAVIQANVWNTDVDMLKAAVRENIREIAGTRHVVESLRRKPYRLGLLSNQASAWVQHMEEKFPYRHLFHHCSYSFATGHLKPEPEAFLAALKALDAKPEETIFVDDMSKNVAAAVELGMTGIHFRKAAELLRDLYRLKLL